MSVDAQEILSFACPSCFTVLKAPAAYAGRKARCKGCGTGVLIPTATEAQGYPVEAFDEFASSAEVKAADNPPSPAAFVAGDPEERSFERITASRPAILSMPKEPWYYRFLSGYAVVIAALGLIQFAGAVLLCLYLLLMKDDQRLPAIMLFAYSSAALLMSLCFAAPVLLGVDAARNLRVMRYLQQR